MAAKKLISARVSKKTDDQINELTEVRGETKTNILAQAIDREYEKYRLEQQETIREEAARKELELRLRDVENELIALKELKKAANNIVEIANKLDQNLDLKTLQSLQSDMAKAIQAFEIMKE